MMSSLELKVPPPLVGVAVGLLMGLAAWLMPLSPLPLDAMARWSLVAVLVAAGLFVDLLGLLAFRAQKTTVNPLRPQRSSALVTAGIYRITRNPMYLGMALLLLALAVGLDAWLLLLGPVLFVLYLTRFQIQPEERALRQLFGAEYTRYCERVRRWL